MTDSRIDDRSALKTASRFAVSDIRWKALVCAVLACELIVLSLAYTNNFTFVCRDAAPAFLCEFLSRSVMRAITFLGAFVIFAFARPSILSLLLQRTDHADQRQRWLWRQLGGFGLVLLPWFFVSDNTPAGLIFVGFVFWILGAALAGIGASLALASSGTWQKLFRTLGPVPLTVLALTVFAPEVTDWARGIWTIEPLTRLTFDMVVAMLDVFGVPAVAQPEELKLSNQAFSILIGSQCSGVEGFALISLFLLCYFYAFAADLRFPHVWLLLPVGLVLSWVLNVVRIATLFTIGVRVSPDLAVEGFHSHAGWLMFSLLAFSMIGASRLVPAFHRVDHAKAMGLPIRQDWMAACILPFAAFMAASLLLSTFTQVPELWYVVKVAVMAAVLTLFWHLYAKLDWKLDPTALSVGAVIGLLWIGVSLHGSTADPSLETMLASLPTGLFVSWAVLRVIGTVALVPMVEELFFRGYILDRLDQGGMLMRILALSLSAGLFAALHERWALAAIAGVIYGLLYLRRRNLVDAVAAHASSNAIIALYAVVTSDWGMI